ncbi:MAG TPA: metallopeptidase TldD-related protein [Thermoanaerobaculia bacterium]|nr:metallopeptidase TldD-related protein [Thermoanaerobaculia bacterium]
MAFPGFDCARIARALGSLCTEPGDLADAFFERLEVTEARQGGPDPGVRRVREEGFALRLVRGGRSWLASRDGIDDELLARAYRQTARALPPAAPSFRGLAAPAWPDAGDSGEVEELLALYGRVEHELRQRRVAFPFRLRARRHRRELAVVGPRLLPEAQREDFCSVEAELPWGRWGGLFCDLAEAPAQVATALAELFRSREAPPPEPARRVVVLGPAAAAVLLHEAVAHTLEADTLALTGKPASAIGVQLAADVLDVLDDPERAPQPVRRTCDDEGIPVSRRWLLRAGRIEQPLADRAWAERGEGLQPGAGRRSQRHRLPVPRSSHLELLPGASSLDELLADAAGGVYLPEATRGRLDPLSGRFRIDAATARRIDESGLGDRLGPVRLSGTVGELLSAVRGVGAEAHSGGAGWCAKGGDRLPVWATAAALRLEDVQVGPPEGAG